MNDFHCLLYIAKHAGRFGLGDSTARDSTMLNALLHLVRSGANGDVAARQKVELFRSKIEVALGENFILARKLPRNLLPHLFTLRLEFFH